MKIEKVYNKFIVYISPYHAKAFDSFKEAKEFIAKYKR